MRGIDRGHQRWREETPLNSANELGSRHKIIEPEREGFGNPNVRFWLKADLDVTSWKACRDFCPLGALAKIEAEADDFALLVFVKKARFLFKAGFLQHPPGSEVRSLSG